MDKLLQRKIERDQRLLERLKIEFGVTSDKALERRLKIPASTLGRVTRGEGPLGWDHRFIIRDKLAFAAVRNTVVSLLPSNLSQSLISASHRQFLARVDDQNDLNEQVNFNHKFQELFTVSRVPGGADCLSALKRYRQSKDISKDAELSVFERTLIVENLVSADPKFWMFLIDKLSQYLATSEALYEAISSKVEDYSEEVSKTNQLLDLLAKKLKLKNESKLADFLGITSGMLSKARSGKAKLPARAAFRMQCFLGNDSAEQAEAEFDEIDRIVSDPDRLAEELNLSR